MPREKVDLVEEQATEPANTLPVVPNHPVTSAEFGRSLMQLAKSTTGRQRMDGLFELGKRLGASDVRNALQLAQEAPEGLRTILYAGIFFSLGKEHGERIATHLLDPARTDTGIGYDLSNDYPEFSYGGAIAGWASADPRAALDFLKRQDLRSFDAKLGTRVAYAVWGLSDLDAALSYANGLPPGLVDVAGEDDFLSWAKADPIRAIDYAVTLDEVLRNTVLERIAHGHAFAWSEPYRTDFWSLLLLAMPGDAESYFSSSVFQWCARSNPELAAEDAVALGGDNEVVRREHLGTVLGIWAEADHSQALEWLQKYSAQHGDGRIVLEDVVRRLSDMNPEKAARLLDAAPEISSNKTLRDGVLSNWMDWDPRGAFEWVVASNPKPLDLLEAARTTGEELAGYSHEEAVAWAMTLPDKSLQSQGLYGAAWAQGYDKPDTSTLWILGLPSGPTRNLCVHGYVTGVLSESLPQFQDEQNRDSADLPAVAAKVQQSSLDEPEKRRLLALIYGWQHQRNP